MRSLLSRRARFLLNGSPDRPSLSHSTFIPSHSPLRTSVPQVSNLSIHLTRAEDSLFSFLEYIQRLYAPETQLRVAGGWVRDKLRGTKTKDIDIALDNIMGATFARYITRFQRDRKLPPSSFGVVKANSDKSKHLEVATVTIEGFTVDLVHLRAEQYAIDSRVPEVTFATPKDDAYRRDLTINALFYNLHTRQVEDFTEKGVNDLIAGVIRTPREPVQTLLDDPLRVLRALRFACDFGFTFDPALEHAVLEQREIVHAMHRKVSRERIGIEVRKLLAGNDPARAFELLRKFKLLDLLFNNVSDDGLKYPEGADTLFQYAPRQWTESIQKRASHCLTYLQHSRRALAQCTISNVEAAAAIFTPLFLPRVPVIIDDELKTLSSLEGMTEQDLVESSLEYLDHRETILATLETNEMIELLKVHVKWPKPAGKRVALIIEAIATYPEAQQVVRGSDAETGSIKHCVQRFMWMTQYHSVIVPALTILVSTCTFDCESVDEDTAGLQERMLTTYLNMASAYAKGEDSAGAKDLVRCRQRLDGKTVQTRLGPEANRAIARALRVLHVWERMHPTASDEDELAFLDRLTPRLRAKIPVQSRIETGNTVAQVQL